MGTIHKSYLTRLKLQYIFELLLYFFFCNKADHSITIHLKARQHPQGQYSTFNHLRIPFSVSINTRRFRAGLHCPTAGKWEKRENPLPTPRSKLQRLRQRRRPRRRKLRQPRQRRRRRSTCRPQKRSWTTLKLSPWWKVSEEERSRFFFWFMVLF